MFNDANCATQNKLLLEEDICKATKDDPLTKMQEEIKDKNMDHLSMDTKYWI